MAGRAELATQSNANMPTSQAPSARFITRRAVTLFMAKFGACKVTASPRASILAWVALLKAVSVASNTMKTHQLALHSAGRGVVWFGFAACTTLMPTDE
eukprot:CAMPEP_0117818154 /NCGR_PEP_ID=MMETSP0949-20121206/1082_1 /TAXON_ID=44440 /ORGANISM="Chattonella subsalsa, Strain CCMP2191" /LENGTH=98 /DNA_ID=CAMNT_0005656621 /DNA_START=787 /DNA_END=1083 /DNA_ORIENTATION=-